jgi:hypothetical protein
MAARKPDYPFLPKTNAHLEAGQFFSFVLKNEQYACVRVLARCWQYQPGRRTLFLAGLMDWTGLVPATADDLAGRSVIDAAWAHVSVLARYGATIDGYRDLETDGIIPDANCERAYGLEVLRNMANLRFAGFTKVDSPVTAFEYERLGWTLVGEPKETPDGEKEYLLEWRRGGSPALVNWKERFWYQASRPI